MFRRKTRRSLFVIVTLIFVLSLLPFTASATSPQSVSVPVTFTILHTNDFHGQLEASGSNPGMARVAYVVNDIRTAVGESKVLLMDVGDEMQGSLLSNIQKGEPTIAVFNAMGYNVATFGNHEFDWGQTVLNERVTQAEYPFVSANIVVNDTGNCATAGWNSPSFTQPYVIQTITSGAETVKVGVIGVTTPETPIITIAEATAGLCFKDAADSILHYYDAMKAEADVLVVLSHLGYADGGYGYGIPVYGDQTLAAKLNTAGKPVNLIIGGHSHTDLTSATVVGTTTIVQAHYNGRKVGRADVTVNPDGSIAINWTRIVVSTSGEEDAAIKALITSYSSDPDYQALINTPIGYVQTDLLRDYNGDSMMADFVDDAIFGYLNHDAEPANDVEIFFNNSGGIRSDWCDKEEPAGSGNYIWSSAAADCQPGVWSHDPMLLTYGQMFSILPFGNATVVGEMTGARLIELLNQAATLGKGAIQTSGMRYSFYRYSDALPGPQPWAWGAFDACVINQATSVCEPIDLNRTYKVGTNEFLAPAGGDNFGAFKYMTNISYWGDMLNAVNAYVSAHYTYENPYRGPNGDGLLDGRITRDGTDAGGSIIPLTILHHNDAHGNLAKGTYVGYTQLATLIKQEKAHNPTRTLLLNAGDQIQGDSMMYYFKSAPLGYAADGTPLSAPLTTHPMMAVMNALGFDAMTIGNHEYNFGKDIFTSVLSQAAFPVMQANVTDDGSYGMDTIPVVPYIEKSVGSEGIKIAILGIGNHRIPNYELPSNIPGLTFSNPLTKAQELSDALRASNDIVLALTHIGFTTNPSSIEVDENVDTNMAAQVSGLDAIIGGHSHTDPSKQTAYSGVYKYLPTIVGGPGNTPVLVTQAYRYNNYLGEVVIGLRPKPGGGYEVVSRAGQYLAVTSSTLEDAEIKAIVDPYVTLLNNYNNTEIGQTTQPIDALSAFTQETNAANLQADASVAELDGHGIDVDFHLSGAMTNRKVAASATPESPVMLKVSDMFSLMPYENSLVVLNMNGPQLKAVLERAFRNYYYYKYVPGYGGYSYYTTCMLDINSGGKITYNDLYPASYDPNKSYVVSLEFDGHEVDFSDASTFYKVSTVNYLAAGSCNFNDGGVSLWPLNQILADTQYYVRDAVINYITEQGVVSPMIEGRLNFITDTAGPQITKTIGDPIFSAGPDTFVTSASVFHVNVSDTPAGVASCSISIAGPNGSTSAHCQAGDNDLSLSGADGTYTITISAADKAGNVAELVEQDILDNSKPQLTKTIGNPKYVRRGITYVNSTTPIRVQAVDASGIAGCTLKIDGREPSVYAGEDFTLPAPDGWHKLMVVCADNLGHSAMLSEFDVVDNSAPTIVIAAPQAKTYLHPHYLRLEFMAVDWGAGVQNVAGKLDGVSVANRQLIDLYTLALGNHTLVVTATDKLGNQSTKSVTFKVSATIQSLMTSVNRFYAEHKIKSARLVSTLLGKLQKAQLYLNRGKTNQAKQQLQSFIQQVQSESGKGITTDAAQKLIADAQFVIGTLK